MSRYLQMRVYNATGAALVKCVVTHTWDNQPFTLDASGLPADGTSPSITITSDYTFHDYNDIDVERYDRSKLLTHFYCDSSVGEDVVELAIRTDCCDCKYYTSGVITSGCYDKG